MDARFRFVCALIVLRCVGLIGAPAVNATERVVALVGAPAPVAGPEVFDWFAKSKLLADERVVFNALLSGGVIRSGLFVASPTGSLTTLAAEGQTISGVGTLGSVFGGIEFDANDAGAVVFDAPITGATAAHGLFLYDPAQLGSTAGPVRALHVEGDAAPGGGGVVFTDFGAPVIDAAGDVVFFAVLSGGSAQIGLFEATALGTVALVLDGDSAPGFASATFSSFGFPTRDAAGNLVFYGEVSTPSGFENGIFRRATDGTLEALAVAGQVAPGTGGATFSSFSFQRPAIGSTDAVSFLASLAGSFPGCTSSSAIVTERGGALSVAVQDCSTISFTVNDFSSLSPPRSNPTADAVFLGIRSSAPVRGLYWLATGSVLPLYVEGEFSSDLGAAFTRFGSFASLNANAAMAFEASLDDGSSGLFVGSAAPDVALPATIGGVIALGISWGARTRLRRRRSALRST